MAPWSAPTAIWLAILFHVCAVRAAFWTYTSRYQSADETSVYTYGSTLDTYTYTGMTRTIKPTVTPTTSALSTSTDDFQESDGLLLVYEWYAADAVPTSDLVPETTYDYYGSTTIQTTYTVYSMEVTSTAPASCSKSFEYITSVEVVIPTQVTDQMVPIRTETDSSGDNVYTYSDGEVWTAPSWVTYILSAGAAPLPSSTSIQYYYSRYAEQCVDPSGNSESTGDDGAVSGSYSYCSYYGGCNTLRIWVIVLAAVLPTLFLLGFVESWFWFRRLMLGQGAMRFGTICWIGISIWVGFFTRFQSRRSPDDQKLLREKWSQMSIGTAFKLWWKWGFRHAYPTELLGQYSINNSGVPGATANGAIPQMGFANGMQSPPPGAPPTFINHNGVIYIPQGEQTQDGPQPTSYINHSGVIYIPQTKGNITPSTTQTSTAPPQDYPAQGDSAPTSHTPASPTEISSMTQSPAAHHAQPAMSEVSSITYPDAHQMPEHQAPLASVEDHPEWAPPPKQK